MKSVVENHDFKININKNDSTLGRKLNIEIPAEVVNQTFQKIFKDIQKKVVIKGFRQGKAPITTIKSIYGQKVAHDVAQELIDGHYVTALKRNNLVPITETDFEFAHPKEGEGFNFSAKFEIRPKIELKNIEGLEIKVPKVEITDDKIDQVLKNIQASKAEIVPVLEDRAAQNGDIAIINFDGYVDSKPLPNGQGFDHQLELGSRSFIDGFEEQVEGMKIDSEKTIHLKFPDPYHAPELAGKDVEFKVKLNALKKKVLPELNDEFVRKLGGIESLEALKKTIFDDLKQSEEKKSESDFKNNLFKILIQNNPIEVPILLVSEQKELIIQDTQKKFKDQGLSDNEFNEYLIKYNLEFENTAREMVQASFIVDEIAKQNDLYCKNEDLEQKYLQFSNQTGIEVEKIKDFYASKDSVQRLMYSVTEDKVIAFVKSKSKLITS